MKLTIKIAIVFALLFTVFLSVPLVFPLKNSHSYESKAKRDIKNLIETVAFVRSSEGKYPNSLQELVPKYIRKRPRDPWGEFYKLYSDEEYIIVFTLDYFEKQKLIYSVLPKKM